MEEELGMLNVPAEVEEQGRGADTEVGFIEVGSIVIPEPIATDPDLAEMFDSLKNAIEMQGQNPEQFTVRPENTLYAYSQDNAIPAHLTNGEFVIPVQVVNVVPNLQEQLTELFTVGELNINQYTVGHPDNSINPTTGYPEFFIKKVWNAVTTAVKDVGKAVKKGVDGVVDFTENFVKALGQGAEDLFKGDIDAVLKNPAVIATASFFVPQYAAYIQLGSKAATGQKITTSDLVSAGFSATTDFTKVKIDPNVTKAVTTAAQIADGADPVQTLVGAYGQNFAKDLQLDTRVQSALDDVVGSEFAQKITNNFDINKAAADFAAGNSTQRILANQFGDDVVNYLGAESPTERAFGFAGIESILQKSEGASDQDALIAGARTYYDQGGALPDLNVVGGLANINVPEIDFGDTGFIKDLYAGTIGKLPDFDVDVPDLGFIEDYVKQYSPQFKGKLDFKGLDLNIADVLKTDLNLRDFDLSGVDVAFDTPDIDLPDFDLPSFNLGLPQPEPREPVQIDPTMIASRQAAQQETPEDQLDIAQLLLSDFSLKNPLLRS